MLFLVRLKKSRTNLQVSSTSGAGKHLEDSRTPDNSLEDSRAPDSSHKDNSTPDNSIEERRKQNNSLVDSRNSYNPLKKDVVKGVKVPHVECNSDCDHTIHKVILVIYFARIIN